MSAASKNPHTTAEYKARLAAANMARAEKLWAQAKDMEDEARQLGRAVSAMHKRALREEKRRLLDMAALLRAEAQKLRAKAAQSAAPADICHCGDYRSQHDERGCMVCRSMPSPRGLCLQFRAAITRATEG